jgi:Protein of unknown function, DUF481
MKKRFIIAVAYVLFCGYATAQINESDTAKYQIRASLTGNYQKGNVEILNIRSRFDFLISPSKAWVFKSQINSLYQAFYDKKADNDIFSRNYLYFKPQNRFYPYIISFISANFRRKIDLRYFVGLGETWQVVNAKNHVLKLSLSAVYEQTNFSENLYNFNDYDGSNQIKLWRGTLYMAGWHNLIDKHLRLFYDAYWQPAFDNSNNYRTQYDIGVDFPIWKGLSFNALYTFTHEHVVVQKIKTDDRILSFGLAYNFKQNRK